MCTPALRSCLVLLLALLTTSAFAQTFTRVTAEAGLGDIGESHGVAWGDYNGDGIDDLFWRRASAGENVIWLMDSNGSPTGTQIDNRPEAWSLAASADYNADGQDDLLWRHSDGRNSIWVLDSNLSPTGTPTHRRGADWQVIP